MNLTALKEKWLLLTLALLQFLHIVDFMVMMPLGPQFMRVFSINAHSFSILISAYTLSAGVAGFIGSFFLDKIERKKILLIILAGFIIGTFFCALSPTYSALLFSRILTGAFGGVLAALVLSILGDTIPDSRRGQAMGIIMLAFSVASILGVPFGLLLSTLFSWTAPFYLLGATGIVVFLLAAFSIPILKEHLSEPKKPNEKMAIVKILSNKNQRFALLMTLSIMLGQFAVIPLVSTFMVTNVGFTEQNLMYIYIFGGIAAMIISPLSGRLGDKLGKFPVYMIFSLCLTVPLFLITNMEKQSLFIPLIIATIMFICSAGRMVCGMALIMSTAESKERAGFMSLNTAVQQLGAGIAAYIAGLIVSQSPSGELIHYNYIGYWAILFAFISIFIASKIKH
jgi:predicted MFS family arabinose efflux permease